MTAERRGGLIPADFKSDEVIDPARELRSELRATLEAVPTDEELAYLYPGKSDREKVRRRLMLKAALHLVFKQVISEPSRNPAPDGSVEVDISDKVGIELSGTLSAAIRDFSHDASRLDQGRKAELVLSPVDQDGADSLTLITAERKVILLALLYIEFKSPHVTEKEQIARASEYTGLTPGTLRTYVRNMRAAQEAYRGARNTDKLTFSRAEYDHYDSARAKMRAIAGRSEPGTIANLIAPALRGLGEAHQKIRAKPPAKR